VANYGSNTCVLYESNGAYPPVFTARTLITATGIYHLVVMDFRGLGRMDILLSSKYVKIPSFHTGSGSLTPW
jgi:hypothetical protein